MFFEGDRIDAMREMILADKTDDRKKALAKLLPYQREDFVGIFKALKGSPATIRFLDPPLHEFLPRTIKEQQNGPGREARRPVDKIMPARQRTPRVQPDARFPRLPPRHRAIRKSPRCRPARLRGRRRRAEEEGIKVKPEIMIPLVGFKKELDLQVEIVHRVAKEVMAEKKVKLNYLVGTMIEVPRGALTADEIAETAEFFSFGTNDLTQTCLGMSRDDIRAFLPLLPRNSKSSRRTRLPRSTRPASANSWRSPWPRAADPPEHQARHLRRTRRRPGLGEVLPQARPQLRELLALPRAGRPPRRRPGCASSPVAGWSVAKRLGVRALLRRFVRRTAAPESSDRLRSIRTPRRPEGAKRSVTLYCGCFSNA
jgi:hypothetical protein